MKTCKNFLIATSLTGLVACTAPKDEVLTEPTAETVGAIYDSTPPEIQPFMQQPAILVFSKTKAWRHNEGIAGADHFFVGLAREKGYGIFTTANSAVFNAQDLGRFQVIIFNNMTGDALSPTQEGVFQNWLESGGAWIGIHGSGDSSHMDWDWYQNELIGPTFTSHIMAPQFQEARVVNLAQGHPVMAGIPRDFMHTDEWYSFDSRPQDHGHTPLAGLDETSYSPKNIVYGDISDLRMGEGAINHPIIWSHCPGKGRAVYSAIGHLYQSFEDENYQRLLRNAFDWVSGKTDPERNACPA